MNKNPGKIIRAEKLPVRSAELFGFAKRQKFFLWLLIWTSLGLFQATRQYHIYNLYGHKYDWPVIISWSLAEWYLWGLLGFVIIRITDKINYERFSITACVFFHILWAVVISMIHLAAYIIIYEFIEFFYMPGKSEFMRHLDYILVSVVKSKLFHSMLTYFLIAFTIYAIRYYKRYRDEENRLAHLETELTRSRLMFLKSQLRPHFLFNALNSIAALIPTDQRKAETMIVRLSELLRIAIGSKDVQKIELQQEIKFLEKYLDIQLIRFQDRLGISWDISPEILDSVVPSMILQPLVENSIKHGLKRSSDGVNIAISGKSDGKYLYLIVRDDGPGVSDSFNIDDLPEGTIANIRNRLNYLYGNEHEFHFKNLSPKGLSVTIKIPFQIENEN